MCLNPGQISLPLDLLDPILEGLKTDRATLLTCSMVCRTWFAFARRHLFRTVIIKPSKTARFLDLLRTPGPGTLTHITSVLKSIDFPGLDRLPHVYPPTGSDWQYTTYVGAILQMMPDLHWLRIAKTYWPNLHPTPGFSSLVQLDLDGVIMLNLAMLIAVITPLGALEALRLDVSVIQSSTLVPKPIDQQLQRLNSLDCHRVDNAGHFFAWLAAHSPMPPITSLRLGDRISLEAPQVLSLIRSTYGTLHSLKVHMFSSQVLPDILSAHTHLQTVTLYLNPQQNGPFHSLFSHRTSTPTWETVHERGKSYVVLTFRIGGD
ncbi:hypothetical protein B0H11DRAFT_338478 [Mycena galericulata]|nr:hypothetical protein B0H11DRAFT_338478 [Mycena galericulata]